MRTLDEILKAIDEHTPGLKSSQRLFIAGFVLQVQSDSYKEGTETAARILLETIGEDHETED